MVLKLGYILVLIGAFTSIFKYIHLGRGCTFCWRRQSGGNSILTLFRSLANQKTLILLGWQFPFLPWTALNISRVGFSDYQKVGVISLFHHVVNDFKTRVYIGAFTSIFKYIHLGRGCTFCWRRQSDGNSILTLFRSLSNQKTLIFLRWQFFFLSWTWYWIKYQKLD